MNNKLFFFLHDFAHQSVFFDRVIIFFADTFPYIVIILAGLFLLFHHEVFQAENTFQVFLQKKKEVLGAFVAGILAWILAYGLKILFHAERPILSFNSMKLSPLLEENGFAFPSGHATFFMALAVSIFLTHKKAGYVFIFFALLIGLARIMAGVHFPGDILGGFALGALIAYSLTRLASSPKNV